MSRDVRRSKKTYGFYRQRPVLTAITGSDSRVKIIDETRYSKSYPSTQHVASISTTARLAGPGVDAVNPFSGSAAGGTSVAVSGSNFTNGSKVYFDGVLASSIVVSNNRILQCSTPAHVAGPVFVSVTNAFGVGTKQNAYTYASAGAAVFDPAVLSLTGWWRANYSGSPWAAVASAGTSGANGAMAEPTNPPSTGANINGLTPADFDGINDQLVNATAIDTMVTDAAGSLVCLFNADVAFADPGSTSYYLCPSLIGAASNSRISLAFSTSGVIFGTYNGAAWDSVSTACGTAAWHLAQARWNATDIEVRIDSGAWVTTSRILAMSSIGSLQFGRNYDVGFFDGRIAEGMSATSRLSDTDFSNIVSYVNSRYGLGL